MHSLSVSARLIWTYAVKTVLSLRRQHTPTLTHPYVIKVKNDPASGVEPGYDHPSRTNRIRSRTTSNDANTKPSRRRELRLIPNVSLPRTLTGAESLIGSVQSWTVHHASSPLTSPPPYQCAPSRPVHFLQPIRWRQVRSGLFPVR